MKTAVRIALACGVGLAFVVGACKVVLSHCEIPCGIYGDTMRVELLYEDITTVEKSMTEIEKLQKETPVNYNQLVRWIGNKEEHATKIQHTVTQYFMTQRVKPESKKYVDQLTSLHGMMLHAMKAKQTTDVAHCAHLRENLDKFAAAYFGDDDLKHIREHHGTHSQ
jgi:nickel superoxide dismutase